MSPRTLSALLVALLAIPGHATKRALPSVPAIPALPATPAALAPSISAPVIPNFMPAVPMAAIPGSMPVVALTGHLSEQAAAIHESVHQDRSGLGGLEQLSQLYDLGPKKAKRSGGGFDASKDTNFVINDENVSINGRAAAYYKEVRRLIDKYAGKIDLSESLDVMDDSYAEVRSKLAAIEGMARARGIEKENTHLEQTLLWVDGVMKKGDKTTAIHTSRVFFHKADNSRSEIAEGIRRADRYLEDTAKYFARGGKAEQALGTLDDIVLAFDARGYDEIKRHLKRREQDFKRTHGARFSFAYVDELSPIPQTQEAVREELNALVRKYKGKGLQKIIEGVIYSRYVGLLLELKTVEHFYNLGYKIDQSGRDLFDATGQYITELDTVVRSPSGQRVVVEAKSARVKIPHEQALADKILYKLDTYKRHRVTMEQAVGGPFEVVFSLDTGSDPALGAFLKGKERELTKTYGFKISFLFLSSAPEEDPGR